MKTAKTLRLVRPALLALAMSLTACGPGPDREQACTAEAPAWKVERESDADYLYGVGTGRSAGGPGIAREKAEFDARQKLATQLDAQVSALGSRLVEDLSINASGDKVREFYTSVQNQYVSQGLTGSEVLEHWEDPCSDYVWALARIERGMLDQLLLRATTGQLDVLELSEKRRREAVELLERELEQRREARREGEGT